MIKCGELSSGHDIKIMCFKQVLSISSSKLVISGEAGARLAAQVALKLQQFNSNWDAHRLWAGGQVGRRVGRGGKCVGRGLINHVWLQQATCRPLSL